MRHNSVPITRENYIALAWVEEPEEWTVEDEMQLPPELRDWSVFPQLRARQARRCRLHRRPRRDRNAKANRSG
jgi:hypothetical protein